MGTQVHYKDYDPGYCPMRNFSEDASSSNWPLFYGDRSLTNGQYCNGFISRSVIEAYPGYDKDAVKQKMLEHEAIFKNQVSELHRLYRIQRDMMQEVKRKEPNRMSVEPSSSSSQLPYEDARKWHMNSLPLAHSNYARASTCSTEMVNSPLSNVQSGRAHFQNGFSSRNSEVLEVRPSKVRKKLFDLQLPADQYIDTDDDQQLLDSKASFCSSYPARGNFTVAQNGNVSRKEASMSNSILRNAFGMADLNEPAQFEEPNATPPVDFLGHCPNPKEAKSPNGTSKANTGVLASSREMMWSSLHGTSNGFINKRKEKEWLPYVYEAGNMKNSLLPVYQGQSHPILNKTSQNPGIREGLWQERAGFGLQAFDRGCESSSFSRVEPMATSLFSSPSPFVNSSEFANLWPPSVSALGRPTQKLTSFLGNPSLNPLAALSGRDRWNGNGIKNGFYNGSSSMSREPSVHFNSQSTNHQYDKFRVDSNLTDSKSAKGFDLNVMNEPASLQDEELVGTTGKLEVITPTLPWLKAKPASKRVPSSECDIKEARNARTILGVPILENPCGSAVIQPPPEEHNRNEKKNIMIDINMAWDHSSDEFEDHVTPEALVGEKVVDPNSTSSTRNHIDLNFCIPEVEEEEEDQPGPSVTSNVRTRKGLEIDLEAPALDTEEEDNILKAEHMQDDAFLELAEDKAGQAQDEVVSVAAEAIVAISTSGLQIEETQHDQSEDPLGKSLHWFADLVSSCADELKCKTDKESRGKGMDSFEVMTLQLTETKEEDYMPKPFIPEFLYADNAGGTSAPNRPRRGQPRRGRQRRDFQRDILPGLSSLSRHEVTEDLQTFGGLMRATGHHWSSALTRRNGTRNGGARGRRRALAIDTEPPPPPPPPAVVKSSPATSLTQQLNNIEAVLEDKSLTGWGKTTRRPRRQRHPAGNPPAVPLT